MAQQTKDRHDVWIMHWWEAATGVYLPSAYLHIKHGARVYVNAILDSDIVSKLHLILLFNFPYGAEEVRVIGKLFQATELIEICGPAITCAEQKEL